MLSTILHPIIIGHLPAYTSSANTVSGNKVHSSLNGGIVLQNCSNNNIISNEATLNTGGSTTNGIILGAPATITCPIISLPKTAEVFI